jgi:hypothetical protein
MKLLSLVDLLRERRAKNGKQLPIGSSGWALGIGDCHSGYHLHIEQAQAEKEVKRPYIDFSDML